MKARILPWPSLKRWRFFVTQFLVGKQNMCPICSVTHGEHSVKVLKEICVKEGRIRSSLTFKEDDDGNIWVISYNRRCLTCGHVWYASMGLRAWDDPRQVPKLVSTRGEMRRFEDEKRKRGGGVPEVVWHRIICEERHKAGFLYRNGEWVKNEQPSQ